MCASSSLAPPPAAAAAADPSHALVLLVDPYSTGCMIAQEIAKRGHPLLAVWTKGFAPAMKTHVPVSCRDLRYVAEVDDAEGWTLADLADAVAKAARDGAVAAGRDADHYAVAACLAGGEAGVDLADALSEHLGVRTNGTTGAFARRRDKKVQQELVRDAGRRAVRQVAGSAWSDVEGFLRSEAFPVVLKPTDSAGSDGVKLCHDMEEAKEHFHHLLQVEAVNGGFNTEILCQEFLRGKEYVVDTVSRDGVHKTMMVWCYDKRPRNGVSAAGRGASVCPSSGPSCARHLTSPSVARSRPRSRSSSTSASCRWTP